MAGRTYPAVTFDIDPQRVAAFAEAIGADPAGGVPPTFAAVYSLGVTAPQHPDPGEKVSSQGRIASDTSRRGMRFVTFETETKGARGDDVCRSRALFVIRS
jgi:hypothetical protein